MRGRVWELRMDVFRILSKKDVIDNFVEKIILLI